MWGQMCCTDVDSWELHLEREASPLTVSLGLDIDIDVGVVSLVAPLGWLRGSPLIDGAEQHECS